MSAKIAFKYLFARKSRVADSSGVMRDFFVAVECYSKDHAIHRLAEAYPFVHSSDWDYLDELPLDSKMGGYGAELLLPELRIYHAVKSIYGAH